MSGTLGDDRREGTRERRLLVGTELYHARPFGFVIDEARATTLGAIQTAYLGGASR